MKHFARWCSSVLAISALTLCGCAATRSDKTQSASAQAVDIQNQGRNDVDTSIAKRANIRLQLAVNYFEEGKYEVALSELKEALRLDPNFAEAHGMLALIYMQLGEKGLAEESFQRALQIKPNDSDINNNYGWFLCQNGHEAQSFAYFENALKNPFYTQPARPLQNAGVCKLKAGDRKAAEDYFRRSFDIDPGGYVAAFNLATLYYERKELERARFYVNLINRSPNITSSSLWLALRIERKLGDHLQETSLAAQLNRQFPAARETELLVRGNYDD